MTGEIEVLSACGAATPTKLLKYCTLHDQVAGSMFAATRRRLYFVLAVLAVYTVRSMLPRSPPSTPYTSQFGQDRWLADNMFYGEAYDGTKRRTAAPMQRALTFVEFGARDGWVDSNTWYFESERGWRGVCAEPMQSDYVRLVTNRPRCASVMGAIGPKAGLREFAMVRQDRGWGPLRWESSSGSTGWNGFVDTMSDGQIANLWKMALHSGRSKYRLRFESIMVQCYKLEDLLEKAKIENVSYMSIDCEGCETEFLTAFDFGRFRVDVLQLEGDGYEKLLAKHGYRLLKSASWAALGHHDSLYLHKSFRPSANPALR